MGGIEKRTVTWLDLTNKAQDYEAETRTRKAAAGHEADT
jgi:hypothetical protein